MKKLLFILLISLSSCSKSISEKDLQYLNGYWEIDLVETADKKTKQYKVNTSVDYFTINGELNGFRKKMKPDFSGKYQSNNRKDSISVAKTEYDFILETSTGLSKHQEIIKELTNDKLILENEAGIKYHYKRHEKFNFNE